MADTSATQGSFTILDINTATPSYHWRGRRLANVVDSIVVRRGAARTVLLTVTDPAAVQPPLTQAEIADRNAIYLDMERAGVLVKKTQQGA